MQDALRLLEKQPEGWPKWELGDYSNGVPSGSQHLFLFEATTAFPEVGKVIPACRFVGGADWIDRTLNQTVDPTADFCGYCVDVEVAHVLK